MQPYEVAAKKRGLNQKLPVVQLVPTVMSLFYLSP